VQSSVCREDNTGYYRGFALIRGQGFRISTPDAEHDHVLNGSKRNNTVVDLLDAPSDSPAAANAPSVS
jgi:hypothetical protein